MSGMHPIIRQLLSYESYVPSKRETGLSATTIISPIQKIILSKRYKSQMDIKLNAASALGTGFHLYAEEAVKKDFKFEINGEQWKVFGTEIKMEVPIGKTGFWLTGTMDLPLIRLRDGLIHIADYKTVKDSGLKTNPKKWAQQLSIYALLAKLFLKTEIDSSGTVIYFNKTKEAVSKFPFGDMVLPLGSITETKKFVMSRTLEIKKYWDLPDKDLPECTPKENWNGRLCHTYCGYVHVCSQQERILNQSFTFTL